MDMSELAPQAVEEVLATCRQAAADVGAVLGRTLDTPVTVTVGQPRTFQTNVLPEELAGSGLAIVLTVGTSGALLRLPESTGLLPEWSAEPDATGQSRLATLARNWGCSCFPSVSCPRISKRPG